MRRINISFEQMYVSVFHVPGYLFFEIKDWNKKKAKKYHCLKLLSEENELPADEEGGEERLEYLIL